MTAAKIMESKTINYAKNIIKLRMIRERSKNIFMFIIILLYLLTHFIILARCLFI